MTETQIATPETETYEITHGILEALLNMTGGDVELQQPPIRSLVRALHGARFLSGSRWAVKLTDEDMKTVVFCLAAYTLNRNHLRLRFANYLSRQSDVFHLAFAEIGVL